MNATSRIMAEVLQTGYKMDKINLHAAKAKLLPPILLYRRILKAHRKALPFEMRSLGDDYVKAEFHRHKTTDNPVHVMGFLLEWKRYLDEIGSRYPIDRPFRGKMMDATVFEKMNNEQLGQLYELMHASKDVWKPHEPGEGESSSGEEEHN